MSSIVPPPHANSFVIGTAVTNTHTPSRRRRRRRYNIIYNPTIGTEGAGATGGGGGFIRIQRYCRGTQGACGASLKPDESEGCLKIMIVNRDFVTVLGVGGGERGGGGGRQRERALLGTIHNGGSRAAKRERERESFTKAMAAR
jgi:hypothetical protein